MGGVISEVKVAEYPNNKAKVAANNKAKVAAGSSANKFIINRTHVKFKKKILGKGDIISREELKNANLEHLLKTGIIKEA